MIAANRANRPKTGSPTTKPANDASITTEDAIVILMMLSIDTCLVGLVLNVKVLVLVAGPVLVGVY